MGADSAGDSSSGSTQQQRAKAAAAAASGKTDKSAAYGFTATRGPAPKAPSTTDGGPVRSTNGTTNARSLSSAERAAMGNDNGGDGGGSPQVAKAAAEKPAEPVISPEEKEQQRIAEEIRRKRRRVAGYRSLLSPSRQDDLSGTLGGGSSV